MEHSKTPWKIGAMESGQAAIDSADGKEVTGFIGMEDTRRILACVNACAGMPQNDVEELAKFGVMELTVYADDMRQQRDQLQSQLATERASLFAENQRKQQLEQQVEELVGVLENVMPWVVTQEVACHGLKCREPVCMSCSSDSEEAAEKATYAYEEARAVIQKVRGGE